ncbi:MAG: glycosyltransferase family 39 protein [Candidatus Hydrogenedentes bacterium]|nr:glycosyltransferase family 39 protein [Candidatus Hydrogenedentota bacterium]
MRPGEWAALAAVLALALGLRLYRIGTESIWYDECITYMGLHFANPMDFFRNEATHDPSSVPLYYGSAFVWYHLGFTSILSIRMLSVAAGMALVAGIYFFGRKLFGHVGGLTAALCVACAKLHVYQSQEIRNYAFTMILALFAMFALYKAAVEGKDRWWPVNVAANVLLSYTHLLGTILLFAQGVYLLSTRPRKAHHIALWTAAHAPFLALIPLWIRLITTADLSFETSWIPFSYRQKAVHAYFYYFAGSKMDTADLVHHLPFEMVPVPEILGSIMLIGGAAFVAYCVRSWWRKCAPFPSFAPASALFVLCWLFVPPATLYIIGKFMHCFLERYVSYSSLALYLCIGGAVAALPKRTMRYAALGALALVFAGNAVDMERPFRYDTASAGVILRDEYGPGEYVYSHNYNIGLPMQFYGGVPEDMIVGANEFPEIESDPERWKLIVGKVISESALGKRSWVYFEHVPGSFEHSVVDELVAQHGDVRASKWHFGGRKSMYLYRIEPAGPRSGVE